MLQLSIFNFLVVLWKVCICDILQYTPPDHNGVLRNFVWGGGGFQQIQLRTEDRENWDLGGGSPPVRGSGGSCNLVQKISFHIVKLS